jgi:uncharacterized membrane protein
VGDENQEGTSPADAADPKETARIEAFSDGVFAIAITLLVLELKVPREHEPGELATALLALWPSYLAFLTSFATIGIMWINHHRLFNLIHRSNQGLLIANSLLLLGVTFIPFPTAVLAEHLTSPDARTAALFYSGAFLVMAVFFQLLWRQASRWGRLLRHQPDPRALRAIDRSYGVGLVLYATAFALAFVNVVASVALNLALAVYFALPTRPSQS